MVASQPAALSRNLSITSVAAGYFYVDLMEMGKTETWLYKTIGVC